MAKNVTGVINSVLPEVSSKAVCFRKIVILFLLCAIFMGAGCNSSDKAASEYTISGTVSGDITAGVTITLSGADSSSTTTNTSGNYSFTVESGTYTVMPSLSGYSFSPSGRSVTVSDTDVTGLNFTSTAVSAGTYTVSGTVSGDITAGVTITLSGADSSSTTTNTSGNYSFTVESGTYTVTPSLSGYSFSPSGRSVTISDTDVTGVDFTSTAVSAGTYTVSGTVSGDITAGVTITLTGADSSSTTTNASGNYSFTVESGTYTVTPSLSGYSFSPSGRSVTISDTDVTGVDFTSTAVSAGTYTVSGTVSGDITAGVTITLSGADSSSTTTNASGDYSFTVESGTYTITPSLSGYTFSPSIRSVTITDEDVSGINFTDTYSSGSENTITVIYSGNSVSVTNPLADDGVAIEITGADVTVTSSAGIADIAYSLSGTTSDGMFKIYSDSDFLLQLNGVEITNLDGPAINIQADHTISVELMDNTASTLTDGETYADPPDEEDQKAAFFSEGQLIFSGEGSLVIYCQGDDQHGLGSDDFISVDGGDIVIAEATKDGIHTNEGYYQTGGTVEVTADSDGVDAGDGPVQIMDGDLTVVIDDDDRDGIKCASELLISGGAVDLTVEGDQSKGLNAADVQLTGGTITIETSGNAVLEESGSGYDPSYCTAIKADNSVVIDGAQVDITATGKAGRGISSDGDIEIYSGQVKITSSGDGGTYTDETGTLDAYHGPCIKADGNVVVEGGTVTLTHSGKGGRGISVDGTLTIGTTESSPVLTVTTTGQEIYISTGDAAEAKAIKSDGVITIDNGNITVSSADDGIKSEEGIEINGGVIDILKSFEGIEAPDISINDGEIHINSSDDGLNATQGSDVEGDDGSLLTINGGYISLSATAGDCIDSNGILTIAGGTVIVHGPPSQPELGVDVNGQFLINGGFIAIAQVYSNMVERPGQLSGQNSILLYRSQTLSGGTLFHIEDTSGNTLVTFAPEHAYSSVMISSSSLTNGTSYRVYTGGSSTGTEKDGIYTGGTYSGGSLRTTFTSSGVVQTINF